MRSHGCRQSRRDGVNMARNLCWGTGRVKRRSAPPASQSYGSEPSRTGVTLAARAVAIDLVQGGSESKPPTRLPVSLVVEEVAGLAFQRPAELIERA